MPSHKSRITAIEANQSGLVCKNGHAGDWEVCGKASRRHVSRSCRQCARDKARKQIYGLSAEAFKQLHEDFPVCAICGQNGQDHGMGILEIDHDHDTGEVRGLLCRRCNIFLGHYEKKKHLIPNIEKYLNVGED